MSDAITPEQLGQRIIDAGLLEARQIDALRAELGTRDVALADMTSLLLRKDLLTNFQLDRLLKGEKGGYFYGDYKVLYLVGTGTFARVYRAVNAKNGHIVAVKSLRKRFREDKAMTEQFVREGKVGLKLRHPSIVPIYEVELLPTPYLTMEFVEGRNLREFTRVRKKLEPLEAMRITVDILAGLAYASEHGMTHRDLKMSNVLVTSRGKGKLVDFGLAGLQPAGAKEDESGNPRTIDYAGLERASGVRNNDPRSDLYFVGTILYNMLTGVSPLGDTKDRMQRLSTARYQNIKPITSLEPNLPPRLASFVMRSLELNADKRHSTAKEMYDDAKRILVKMEAGDFSEPEPAAASSAALGAGEQGVAAKIPSDQEGANRTVMLIESKIEMQDLLRERLKKHGYRVLVFSDPVRAINRFVDGEPKPADGVIFCCPNLGEDALTAFNEFGARAHTKDIPAVLFVDNKQTDLIRAAQLSDHRVILSMPMRVRELREMLLKLLRPEANSGAPASG
ncbi:MAG: serine/threonine-protein kinase [Pirellulaceae bacterium]|nr:serine/threonine-protein kinase [Pirellulaceae bacterium]